VAARDQECTLCRTIKPASAFSLTNKICNQCRGKVAREKTNSSLEEFLKMRIGALRQRHKSRGYSGSPIDLPYIAELYADQNGICAITGIPMHTTTEESDLSVSPDRIDNTKGYIEGNVRLVCARANMMQSNLDDAHFQWWCRAVVHKSGN